MKRVFEDKEGHHWGRMMTSTTQIFHTLTRPYLACTPGTLQAHLQRKIKTHILDHRYYNSPYYQDKESTGHHELLLLERVVPLCFQFLRKSTTFLVAGGVAGLEIHLRLASNFRPRRF